ncbi:MAG: 4Fe-4S binding protein [Candidatus Methanoplasma sp.]|jgi:pyruvate ferredoxin oxidoreductase delta subunit|nr:4Fe-4S binding protein [Candidatus Methanoplasma sp.]
MVNMADYKTLTIGDRVITAGNSEQFKTGDWRSLTPVLSIGKCINCLTCWIYCPDSCVIVENEKMTGFKLSHCKGCGICAESCPKDAIAMTEERA